MYFVSAYINHYIITRQSFCGKPHQAFRPQHNVPKHNLSGGGGGGRGVYPILAGAYPILVGGYPILVGYHHGVPPPGTVVPPLGSDLGPVTRYPLERT